MKSTLLKKALFIAAASLSFNSYSQNNYYGVTGNMVAGDFDQDGLTDDIAAFNTATEIPKLTLWTLDNGKMQEQDANCQLSFDFLGAKSLNAKIVAGDFDNDGFIDDLASIYEIGVDKTSVTVWLNNKGQFTPQRWWYGADFDANQTYQTMVAGDFDNDGFMDDIAAFYNYEMKATKVYVWMSDKTQFGWPGTWWIGKDFDATRIQGTLAAGDFDCDGFKDDMAALYDYSDGFCKAFVWTTDKNKFNWPYTWFAQSGFDAGKLKGNVIAGDFDQNGFDDNLAALYQNNENSSSIIVFKRDNKGFELPDTWWYGANEAITANMRLVTADLNNNAKNDQFTGLTITGTNATLTTWTAENNRFTLPEEVWQGFALSLEDCNKQGGCITNDLAGGINVYPNPNNGQFNIEIPKTNDELIQVTFYNVLGSQVLSLQAQTGQILSMDMSNLKAGSYVVQITGNEINLKQNFIIQ
jgi:hypothetical protein